MRLLHTADWHLGRTLEGRSRFDEQARFLEELYQIVEEEKIDVVLMAGDVFDTVNPPAAAEQLFYDCLARLTRNKKRKVIIIAGNHDNPDRLGAAGPIANLHGITLVGYPRIKPLEFYVEPYDYPLKIAALPYPSEARLNDLITDSFDEETLRDAYDKRIEKLFQQLCSEFDNTSVNVATSHIYVAGGRESESERPIHIGGAYSITTDALPPQVQYVALGHLHRPQSFGLKNGMARYAGSPLSYSFSEAGQSKSVTILDIKPGSEPDIKEKYLSSGKPLVRWRATEGLPQVYKWLDEGRDAHAWIDLEVYVKDVLSMEEIQRLRSAHPGFIHIRPIFKEMETVRAETRIADQPIDEVFCRFYQRQMNGGTPDDETIKLFLKLINQEEGSEVK